MGKKRELREANDRIWALTDMLTALVDGFDAEIDKSTVANEQDFVHEVLSCIAADRAERATLREENERLTAKVVALEEGAASNASMYEALQADIRQASQELRAGFFLCHGDTATLADAVESSALLYKGARRAIEDACRFSDFVYLFCVDAGFEWSDHDSAVAAIDALASEYRRRGHRVTELETKVAQLESNASTRPFEDGDISKADADSLARMIENSFRLEADEERTLGAAVGEAMRVHSEAEGEAKRLFAIIRGSCIAAGFHPTDVPAAITHAVESLKDAYFRRNKRVNELEAALATKEQQGIWVPKVGDTVTYCGVVMRVAQVNVEDGKPFILEYEGRVHKYAKASELTLVRTAPEAKKPAAEDSPPKPVTSIRLGDILVSPDHRVWKVDQILVSLHSRSPRIGMETAFGNPLHPQRMDVDLEAALVMRKDAIAAKYAGGHESNPGWVVYADGSGALVGGEQPARKVIRPGDKLLLPDGSERTIERIALRNGDTMPDFYTSGTHHGALPFACTAAQMWPFREAAVAAGLPMAPDHAPGWVVEGDGGVAVGGEHPSGQQHEDATSAEARATIERLTAEKAALQRKVERAFEALKDTPGEGS